MPSSYPPNSDLKKKTASKFYNTLSYGISRIGAEIRDYKKKVPQRESKGTKERFRR